MKRLRQTNVRRRVLIVCALFLLVVLAGAFLSYENWRQVTTAKAYAQIQQKEFAELDKKVATILKQRIESAKKAEAEAKAKALAEAEKAQTVQQPSVRVPSTPSTPKTCDVTTPQHITVVINKKHCFHPIEWAPSDLSSVNGYPLRAEAANQLIAMMNAANTAGYGFDLSSAYRSYANQAVTYNYWVSVNGSAAAADTVSARPGYSEHQTGLAADLKVGSCVLDCFGTTAQFTWLQQHAAAYGFIERYPVGLTSITGYSAESWHWRYVGTATAQDMKTKGIQTLEQYFGVTGGDY